MARFDRPPRQQSLGKPVTLALLMHVLLVAMLAFGTHWRSSEPEAVDAELWSSVPQLAAPRVAPPPPEPPTPQPVLQPQPAPKAPEEPKPDIALEQKKLAQERAKLEQQQEQQRLEQEKLAKKQQEEKRKREEQALLQQVQQDQQARLAKATQGLGAPDAAGTAQQSRGFSAGYAGRIAARVRPNITFTDPIDGNPKAVVEIRLGPDGVILSKRLVTSSGNAAWDDAVLRAIDKTEQVPKDVDGTVPRTMILELRPQP